MKEAVFIDRDGVICENRSDYVKSWSEFVFLPNAVKALAALHQAGYSIIIVTNQSAVGRGLIDLDTLHGIHVRMEAIIEEHGGHIEEILYCPHHPDDGCYCRKPQPGMLMAAAQSLNLDLHNSYMIGDACTDIQAGQAAGTKSFLVLTGRGMAQLPLTLRYATGNFQVVPRLDVAVEHIINSKRANDIQPGFLTELTRQEFPISPTSKC